MIESTHLFGPHRHLAGTLTMASEQASTQNTACVLMSAGVINRPGPHRINVKLARALASQGMTTMRVDLAAVGDSRTPPTDTAYDRQAVIDLSSTIDRVQEQTGAEKVIMVGICSGAIYSLRCALLDTRVCGLFLIDGYAYPTARSQRERYLQRVRTLTPGVIGRSLRNRLSRSHQEPTAPASAPDYGLSHPPLQNYARDLRQLMARGVAVTQLYSGSILQYYNYQQQFADAFADYPDIVAAIPAQYHPAIDHTMTSLEAQRALIGHVMHWQQSLGQPAGQNI